MLLAIDTSTRFASVALYSHPEVVSELTWQSEMNHSVELFSAIDNILRPARKRMNDLTLLAVAVGPGSFNGIRVGVSAAKGLAFGLGIPLVGISTLETQAYQHSWSGKPVCAVLRAGREEVAAALFERRYGHWVRLMGEQITTLMALDEKITTETIFTGDLDADLASSISAVLGPRALILPAEARLRRAGFLAALGWQMHEAGQATDAVTLQPMYLRRPPITTRQKL